MFHVKRGQELPVSGPSVDQFFLTEPQLSIGNAATPHFQASPPRAWDMFHVKRGQDLPVSGLSRAPQTLIAYQARRS